MVYTCEITSFAHLRLHQRTIPPIDESGNNFLIWQWYFFSVRRWRRGGIYYPSHWEREWILAKSKSRRGDAGVMHSPALTIDVIHRQTDRSTCTLAKRPIFVHSGWYNYFCPVSCRSFWSRWWDRGSCSIITISRLSFFCCCWKYERLILIFWYFVLLPQETQVPSLCEAGFKKENISTALLPISPPKECRYYAFNHMITPTIIKA